MNTNESKGTALVSGASSGIGVVYADRLAKRAYHLILVARTRDRLASLAEKLRRETARTVEIIVAGDATRAGFDQGEVVTIPSLPQKAKWDAYEAARRVMSGRLSSAVPGARHGLRHSQRAEA
jgi:NAD(P)-dependent dehydrogenase (short-subunit alcohol dehydrogenase family)